MARSAFSAAQPVEQFFQFSLLGMLASGYFAVLGSGFLDLPTAVFAACGLLLRLFIIAGLVNWDFSGKWASAATLAYMGFYPIDYFYLSRDFINATVHLVFFLAIVRILTAKTDRDFFFVKVIAFLELLSATLLSSGLNFFVFLLLFVVSGVATFCCSEIRRSARSGRRITASPPRFGQRLGTIAVTVTVGIALMTAALFFMLPRTARAAFRSSISQRYAPGFANEVNLGRFGEIRLQSTPVMHVLLEHEDQKLHLKWRGSALTQFDGKRWYNPPAVSAPIAVSKGHTWLVDSSQLSRAGKRVTYEVRIGAMNSDALFFAGEPESLRIGVSILFRGMGNSYRTGLPSTEGTRYTATSYVGPQGTNEQPAASLSLDDFNEHLLLPMIDRRIVDLSRKITQGRYPAAKARAIEQYLRTSFGYTTQLLDRPVSDPLAHFLFDRRQGHCEYFASAMAVMLRAVHIPSRVITGFQPGTLNPITGWNIVRASDAHSWVEAWLPGAGWTAFDPTPADTSSGTGDGAMSQLALYMDAADMFWQQWVMNYDLEQQISLASTMEASRKTVNSAWLADFSRRIRTLTSDGWRSAERYAAVGIALVLLTAAIILCGPRCWKTLVSWLRLRRLRHGQIAVSDAALLYGRMLDVMRRRGYEKPAWLTPAEFASILPPGTPTAHVAEITTLYNQLRYARDTRAGVRIVELIKQLEASPS